MLCIVGSRIIRSKDLHVPAKGLNIVSATCSMVSSAVIGAGLVIVMARNLRSRICNPCS